MTDVDDGISASSGTTNRVPQMSKVRYRYNYSALDLR